MKLVPCIVIFFLVVAQVRAAHYVLVRFPKDFPANQELANQLVFLNPENPRKDYFLPDLQERTRDIVYSIRDMLEKPFPYLHYEFLGQDKKTGEDRTAPTFFVPEGEDPKTYVDNLVQQGWPLLLKERQKKALDTVAQHSRLKTQEKHRPHIEVPAEKGDLGDGNQIKTVMLSPESPSHRVYNRPDHPKKNWQRNPWVLGSLGVAVFWIASGPIKNNLFPPQDQRPGIGQLSHHDSSSDTDRNLPGLRPPASSDQQRQEGTNLFTATEDRQDDVSLQAPSHWPANNEIFHTLPAEGIRIETWKKTVTIFSEDKDDYDDVTGSLGFGNDELIRVFKNKTTGDYLTIVPIRNSPDSETYDFNFSFDQASPLKKPSDLGIGQDGNRSRLSVNTSFFNPASGEVMGTVVHDGTLEKAGRHRGQIPNTPMRASLGITRNGSNVGVVVGYTMPILQEDRSVKFYAQDHPIFAEASKRVEIPDLDLLIEAGPYVVGPRVGNWEAEGNVAIEPNKKHKRSTLSILKGGVLIHQTRTAGYTIPETQQMLGWIQGKLLANLVLGDPDPENFEFIGGIGLNGAVAYPITGQSSTPAWLLFRNDK